MESICRGSVFHYSKVYTKYKCVAILSWISTLAAWVITASLGTICSSPEDKDAVSLGQRSRIWSLALKRKIKLLTGNPRLDW